MRSFNLRIGIDFHGVITSNPTFFRNFTALAISKGHEIFIVSGGPFLVEKKFLDAWHIQYTQIFSLLDHFASCGQVEYFDNGNFKVPDELWNKAKAQYCQDNNIDIQIDDTAHYGTEFSTPFCLYNPETASCTMPDSTSVSFNKSPATTLSEIEKIVLSAKK